MKVIATQTTIYCKLAVKTKLGQIQGKQTILEVFKCDESVNLTIFHMT